MRNWLLCLTALFTISASANTPVETLIGTYQSISCPYYAETTIFKNGDFLYVEARRASSEYFAFTEKIKLNTRGKKFNCTPGGSYGDVQCRVRETNTRIISEERGCLIACGPWHLQISIQKLSDSEIGIINHPEQKEACVFRKL